MSIYKTHPFYKIITIPVLSFVLYGVYSSYIDKEYFNLFLSILGVVFILYIAIGLWKLKLILNNEGIRVKSWIYMYIWQDFLKWEEVQKIDTTYGAYSTPYYILVQKEGRSMYVAGVKNMNKLLLEITQYAPHVKLHPKVRKKVEKAKNKL